MSNVKTDPKETILNHFSNVNDLKIESDFIDITKTQSKGDNLILELTAKEGDYVEGKTTVEIDRKQTIQLNSGIYAYISLAKDEVLTKETIATAISEQYGTIVTVDEFEPEGDLTKLEDYPILERIIEDEENGYNRKTSNKHLRVVTINFNKESSFFYLGATRILVCKGTTDLSLLFKADMTVALETTPVVKE